MPSNIPPVPKQVGGTLIRKLIKGVRKTISTNPHEAREILASADTQLWVSLSGGADSVALALLISKYGRRIISKNQIRFIYFEHHWRPEDKKRDHLFLNKFAKKCGVPLTLIELNAKDTRPNEGRSWEEASREARKKAFEQLSKKNSKTYLLTAHHQDDLIETQVWRFFTGSWFTHGQGIMEREGQVLRPCLEITKHEILEFLREEKQKFLIDSSNENLRFLRAKLRKVLIPAISQLFPPFKERLIEYRQRFQGEMDTMSVLPMILETSHIHVRRNQLAEFKRWVETSKAKQASWDITDSQGALWKVNAMRTSSKKITWEIKQFE